MSSLMPEHFGPWLEIDRLALQQNMRALRARLQSPVKLMAMVKSNAYGHGLKESARAIADHCDWFGVVTAAEALKLREAGITQPILVVGVTAPKELADLARQDISVTCPSGEWLMSIEPSLSTLAKPLRVHLKIETGLHRLGIEGADELLAVAKQLTKLPNVILEGTHSHFGAIEQLNDPFTREQGARFIEQAKLVHSHGLPVGLRHMASSAAMFLYPEYHFDMVRCGIAVYGLWKSEAIHHRVADVALTPALTMKTRVVQVKTVTDGSIGYGRGYTVQNPLRIAVIAVGYGDGYDRGLSNIGDVLISGQRCPIVGRVAMNMTMADISAIEGKSQNAKVKIGDEVVLIGKQGGQEITADELAKKLETINYEIVTRLSADLPRIYKN